MESKIISLTDAYYAMISNHAYRKELSSQKAMSDLYTHCQVNDEALTQCFIKDIGIYPPGAFVMLKTKEVAMVIRRNQEDLRHPKVKAIIGPDEKVYKKYILRDTKNPNYSILKPYMLEKEIEDLNIPLIWGYV